MFPLERHISHRHSTAIRGTRFQLKWAYLRRDGRSRRRGVLVRKVPPGETFPGWAFHRVAYKSWHQALPAVFRMVGLFATEHLWIAADVEAAFAELAPAVHGVAPPFGGLVLGLMLLVLSAFDLQDQGSTVGELHQKVRHVGLGLPKKPVGDAPTPGDRYARSWRRAEIVRAARLRDRVRTDDERNNRSLREGTDSGNRLKGSKPKWVRPCDGPIWVKSAVIQPLQLGAQHRRTSAPRTARPSASASTHSAR